MGHNRVNCTNIDPEMRASTSAPEPNSEPRRSGQLGHTRSRCNLYNVDIK